ncbi:MAG: helix-turn-helix transcriptional regulator [Methylocella sp.]
MQMIASHIERAFHVRDLLSEDRTLSELLGSAIARAGFGLILATADRRIVYANDAAETLMRAGNGLRCERNCISAADFASSRKLQSLITAASRQTDQPVQGGSHIFRDEDGMASLAVHVVPVSPHSGLIPPGKESPVAGILVVDCKRRITDRINAFAHLFDLTSAEARVASQLVSGEGLTKAASNLNIARSTARFHLTNILEKTGAHRQAELVRVFYEVTIPRCGRRRAEDKSLAAVAGGLPAGHRGQGVQLQGHG